MNFSQIMAHKNTWVFSHDKVENKLFKASVFLMNDSLLLSFSSEISLSVFRKKALALLYTLIEHALSTNDSTRYILTLL